MVKNKKKTFLILGLIVPTIAVLPIAMISCEASEKRKLNSALNKNRKLRAELAAKTNGYNGFEEFSKKIRDELASRLTNVTDSVQRINIYKDLIARVNASNDDLTSMRDSIN